jgi:hypothetical protein
VNNRIHQAIIEIISRLKKQNFEEMKMLLTASLFISCAMLTNYSQAQNKSASPALLRHIVIITFNEHASADSIKALDNVYISLSKSSSVKEFEWGANFSTRDTTHIKHVYMTSFASKDDLKDYSKNPLYPQLFKISLAIADDVNVVDYWATK